MSAPVIVLADLEAAAAKAQASPWRGEVYAADPATVAALCAAIREMVSAGRGSCRTRKLLAAHGIVLDPREPAAGARTGVTPAAEGETP